MTIDEKTRAFIREHADEDVRQLALKYASMPELPFVLDQISGRQMARHKLPSWSAIEDIVYPPHISMEQCSSEFTARYKAQLVGRLCQEHATPLTTFADLTGGFGVDFTWMAQAFRESCGTPHPHLVYVERNAHLCDIVGHNLPLLGLREAEVVCGEIKPNKLTPIPSQREGSLNTLVTILHTQNTNQTPLPWGGDGGGLLFLDPARRDDHGGRTYALADCTPNVLEMRDELLGKADYVVLKLSPMLDWRKAVSDLGPDCVSEVHIVSVDNECKELLIVMQPSSEAQQLRVYCINNHQVFNYYPKDGKQAEKDIAPLPHREGQGEEPVGGRTAGSAIPSPFLYVPNASIMKAGCFAELCQHFGLVAVGPNSHLFVNALIAQRSNEAFPGRVFQISAVSSMNKHDLKTNLKGITQANIATRNFPMKAEELRRRLKLRDGGDTYIFATTFADGTRKLLICQKATTSSDGNDR